MVATFFTKHKLMKHTKVWKRFVYHRGQIWQFVVVQSNYFFFVCDLYFDCYFYLTFKKDITPTKPGPVPILVSPHLFFLIVYSV